MNIFDAVILGAGASGMWCAHTAAARGLSVCLVDHAKRPGKKIRIAGGGKCNFTNLEVTHADYVSRNPHFVKSALARFSPWHMVEFLSKHDIAWEEREHSQLFCQRSSDELATAIEDTCSMHGVEWRLRHAISGITHTDGLFTVATDNGPIKGRNLVVALGGPAWPQAGATDFGHRIAKQFGHAIVAPYPALAPFAMPKGWALEGLSGIAVPATIECGEKRFTENLLFTHTGISGPVVLHASCRWKKDMPIVIDFLPSSQIEQELKEAGGKPLVRTVLGRLLPDRLVAGLLPAALADKQVAQLSRQDLDHLTQRVHSFTVTPARTEGMKRAEVTGGGVDTDGISSKTMESKRLKGLYFTGEVLDVTGQLGGFNLHWAWASGQAAGIALAESAESIKA
ncbi:NAD(P)/FAD-dependent oxidoreductase [Desulfovibrio mangrovi]|uniref:NAD(P)/FAD-dependent oxidoreductase n=1 Tax=Desulfovibrio mangrovi TaxID=2976983 RepID=UPI002245F1F7|nr:NAD(P)/FAD-dependent oxidoreductase [Desulfovibrio mangrovi]UZP68653.1 NAD(P)/FAD-dependent oxidoreductase [Desulfovibrio mangrovi]